MEQKEQKEVGKFCIYLIRVLGKKVIGTSAHPSVLKAKKEKQPQPCDIADRQGCLALCEFWPAPQRLFFHHQRKNLECRRMKTSNENRAVIEKCRS
jgi:hypothetical protein